MKNILKYGLLGLGVIATTSCIDTLDTKPKVIFDAEQVWGSKATVEGFVYNAYNDIIWNGYAGSGSCISWESRTPNSALCTQLGDLGSTFDNITLENIGASDDFGVNRFKDLRRANMIIENVENSSTLTEDAKKQLKAHGHMLRGMIFFQQARLMGRFVPVTQVFETSDSLTCLIPLTASVEESYKYVINDLKYAADNMEDNQPYGVPTKWAAKVILSRAALQAYAYTKNSEYLDIALNTAKEVVDNKGNLLTTSDGMFNETDMYNPEILWAYYREEQNTQFVSFYETMRTFPNVKPGDVGSSPYATPMKDANGITFEAWGLFQPTQDLVDNFLVNDAATGEAKPWYETSQWLDNVDNHDPATIPSSLYGTDSIVNPIDKFYWMSKEDREAGKKGSVRRMPTPTDFKNTNTNYPTFKHYATLKEGATKNISQLMYENRDKRFYTAVVYDGCKWFNEDIELFHGGNVYRGFREKEDGGWYNTTTNYYWRKSTIESFPRAYHNLNMAIHFNLARVGEAYLNLAEAYLLKGQIANAVEALNATRTTHGGIAPSTATTEEEAWKDYIRERNCELTNEGGDLYWSYLRWGKYGGYANPDKDGNPTNAGGIIHALNRPVHMVQIDHERKTVLVNQLTLNRAAERKFTERRYLLPVDRDFLNTRATYGIQDNYTQEW